jgi:serine protease AprX
MNRMKSKKHSQSAKKNGKRTKVERRTVARTQSIKKSAIAAPRQLSVEVVLRSAEAGVSPFGTDESITCRNVETYRADNRIQKRAAHALTELGFKIVALSPYSISVECAPSLFSKTFGTKLQIQSVHRIQCGRSIREKEFHAPAEGANWEPPPVLKDFVERAYIQPPAIYLQSPLPPKVDYFHLNIPDLATLTRARQVHQQGITGKGVKVVMIDSGFFKHPFYQMNGFNGNVVLAPGALNPAQDKSGHGTAQAANVFAVAPGIAFVMVKQGPNPVAALKKAIELGPDIIICSWCFDLVEPNPNRRHLTNVPSTFKSLELGIAHAVSKGICVVCAAGNGQVAFPGMHPDVICAGGIFVGPDVKLTASNLASAFSSKPYPGRHVPDLCGLVGMQPAGLYILLPVQPGSNMDQALAAGVFPASDKTLPNDGWVGTSGTSAAAPQIAGVCALLKQKNPSLTPQEMKQSLIAGASDCSSGAANADSNEGLSLKANAGPDGATGHGLVNAAASVSMV